MLKRLDWIDSYRGLLILLVTLGHLSVPLHTFDGIRIPAFFFISGFLFSRSYDDFFIFFKRRFRQIVIPYVAFFLIVYATTIIINMLLGKPLVIIEPILAMLYGSFSWDMGFSKSLWFVTTLFTTEIYFFFIKKYIKNNQWMIVVLLFFSALGYLSTLLGFRLPWGMDIACSVVLFYGLGYLVKVHGLIDRIEIKNLYLHFFVGVSLLLVSYYFSYGDRAAVFVLNKIESPVYTIFSGVFGIFATIFLLKISFIKNNSLLIYFGKNTFIILAFHELLMHVSAKLTLKTTGISASAGGFGDTALYVVVTILLLIPVIELINKFLPFILNRPK